MIFTVTGTFSYVCKQIFAMWKFGNYELEFVQNSLQLNPFNFNMERITFQVVSVKAMTVTL